MALPGRRKSSHRFLDIVVEKCLVTVIIPLFNFDFFFNIALNIIKDNPESFVQKSLICSFMPKFISLEPKDTIDVLKKLGRNLEPIAVLPSLIFPYHNDVQVSMLFISQYVFL